MKDTVMEASTSTKPDSLSRYMSNTGTKESMPLRLFSSIEIASAINWMTGGDVHQMDVSSAFLSGSLQDDDELLYRTSKVSAR